MNNIIKIHFYYENENGNQNLKIKHFSNNKWDTMSREDKGELFEKVVDDLMKNTKQQNIF